MMTDWVNWFRYQLKASEDGFAWAFEQLPIVWHYRLPPAPHYLGTWPPIRHVWHVMGYERDLVIPSMRQWLSEPMPKNEIWQDDDPAFALACQAGLDGVSTQFRAIRQQQIDLLDQLAHVDWDEPRTTLWGHKPLSMIVTKTYQHTFEHGDTLLRMGLWWQKIEDEQKSKSSN